MESFSSVVKEYPPSMSAYFDRTGVVSFHYYPLDLPHHNPVYPEIGDLVHVRYLYDETNGSPSHPALGLFRINEPDDPPHRFCGVIASWDEHILIPKLNKGHGVVGEVIEGEPFFWNAGDGHGFSGQLLFTDQKQAQITYPSLPKETPTGAATSLSSSLASSASAYAPSSAANNTSASGSNICLGSYMLLNGGGVERGTTIVKSPAASTSTISEPEVPGLVVDDDDDRVIMSPPPSPHPSTIAANDAALSVVISPLITADDTYTLDYTDPDEKTPDDPQGTHDF